MLRLRSRSRFIINFRFSALLIYFVMTLKFDRSSRISPSNCGGMYLVNNSYHRFEENIVGLLLMIVALSRNLMTLKVACNVQRTKIQVSCHATTRFLVYFFLLFYLIVVCFQKLCYNLLVLCKDLLKGCKGV